jgi:serine protease Do
MNPRLSEYRKKMGLARRAVMFPVLMAAASLATAGCQPPGDPAAKPKFGYSLLYNQNDQLRDLLEKNDLQSAKELYAKEKPFFSSDEAKYSATLAVFAAKVNAKYEPRFVALAASLSEFADTDDKTKWSGAKETISAAQTALTEYDGFLIVEEQRYASGKADDLKAKLDTLRSTFENRAPAALAKYSDIAKTNFFEVYPVHLEERRVFAAALPRLLSRLQAGTSADFLEFAHRYSDAIGEEKTQVAVRRAFIRSWLREQGQTVDAAKLAEALESLKSLGITSQQGESEGMAVVLVASADARQAEFDVAMEDGLPVTVRRIRADALDAELRDLDYAIVVRLKTARLLRNMADRTSHASTYIAGYRTEPNPDYEAARFRVAQAQSNLNNVRMRNAIDRQDATTLLGGLSQAVSETSAQLELRNAMAALQRTPPTVQRAVSASYNYVGATVSDQKKAEVDVLLVQKGTGTARKFSVPLQEERSFTLVYNVHDKDPDRSQILASAQTENAVSTWEKEPLKISLMQVLADLLPSHGEAVAQASLHLTAAAANSAVEAPAGPAHRETRRARDPRFDSVVIVSNPLGLGAGFFVRPDVILTNRHVVEGSGLATVKNFGGQEATGKVIAVDVRLDLALVRVPLEGPPVAFAKPDEVEPGMTVEAIGHPDGLYFSITKGVVSALRTLGGVEYVQTDTTMNHGNSGGPLFLGREVVGVSTWGRADANNLNFAIDFREVQRFIQEHL